MYKGGQHHNICSTGDCGISIIIIFNYYFRDFWSGKKNLNIGDYVHLHSGRAEAEET